MRFREARDDEEVLINITPLIDVVFLLLIFFMVSTTFEKYSELEIALPEATVEPAEGEPETLDIVIDAEGRYFVNGDEVAGQGLVPLQRAIERIVVQRRELPVMLRADAATPHQAVVTALDALSQLGMSRVSIATTRVSPGPN